LAFFRITPIKWSVLDLIASSRFQRSINTTEASLSYYFLALIFLMLFATGNSSGIVPPNSSMVLRTLAPTSKWVLDAISLQFVLLGKDWLPTLYYPCDPKSSRFSSALSAHEFL